ncbi:MAG TPA: FG-GAP-like repeat-containing protein, partial [Rhodothermales bacterium]|nr:FG-GAP-like repeat-containing protein [Rhodothermales bacterium]
MMRSVGLSSLIGLFFWLTCACESVGAQSFSAKPLLVWDETGQPYRSWPLGGLNTPQLQWLDVTGDNRPDLFLQNQQHQVFFFRNDPTEGLILEHLNAFPDVFSGNWFQLWPDQDDSFLLFASNDFDNIQVWRVQHAATRFITLKLAEVLLDTEGKAVFAEIGSIPQFTDIDCDGDLDYFTTNQSGTITFYEQVGQTTTGLPRYTKRSDRFADISLLGTYCDGQALTKSLQHGAASITFYDTSGSGKPDILWTDTFIAGLLQLKNTGTCSQPAFTFPKAESQYANFLVQGLDLQTSGFNLTTFGDADVDGDQDLFIGVQGGFCPDIQGDAIHNLFFYRNTGTAQKPIYTQETKRFLYMPDLGRKSSPAFFDYDQDGDLDLVVGNEDHAGSPNFGRLTLYEAIGNKYEPGYVLKDPNFLNITGAYNVVPAFGDVDTDGDLDLLLGMQNGRIRYYRNEGVSGFREISRTYANIFVGTYSAPALADIDSDGDLDLLVGNASGTLTLYRNVGSPQIPDFSKESDQYAGISVNGFSKPAFLLQPQNNQLRPAYLVVGSESDGAFVYKNISTGAIDAVWILDGVGSPNKPFRGIGQESYVLRHLAPATITWTLSNTLPNMIFGTEGGGFIAATPRFLPMSVSSTTDMPSSGPYHLSLFPNPITDQFSFYLPETHSGPFTVSVYDLLGRERYVKTWETPTGSPLVSVEVPDLVSGAYLVRLSTAKVAWSSIV